MSSRTNSKKRSNTPVAFLPPASAKNSGSTIKGLEMAMPGRNIAWKVASMLQVMGDSSTLKQVFANLIGHAVKYSAA